MPGYEPFLLCDFHVHTQWSDGQLPLREVVDLYGKTGRFDVIGITDQILMARDLLPQVGRFVSTDRRPRLADLVDVWEAADRDVSVASLKHHPHVANDDFHKLDRLYSWKTLVRCEKNWDVIARTLKANVDIAMMLDRNASCAA